MLTVILEEDLFQSEIQLIKTLANVEISPPQVRILLRAESNGKRDFDCKLIGRIKPKYRQQYKGDETDEMKRLIQMGMEVSRSGGKFEYKTCENMQHRKFYIPITHPKKI